MKDLDLSADVIDVRDIIERIEKLEVSKETHQDEPEGGHWSDEEAQELANLMSIMEEMKGYGGDEQWRGDWYPLTLIAESYFTEYCQELVSDIGDMPRDIPDYIEIDWEATAQNLKVDYSEVEVNGFTYFYR
jgi:hypothetical protein